jgi:carboxynorspermidine decarboxylase
MEENLHKDANRRALDPAMLLSNSLRPAPLDIPFGQVETPAFVVDLRLLKDNLTYLKELKERLNIKILLAQKAYSLYKTYPLIGSYLDGTTSSGLYEARLGAEEMAGKEVHVFSPAYKESDIDQLLGMANHLIFNSFSQWVRHRDKIMDYKAKTGQSVHCGLRINPNVSVTDHDMYNPAAPGSRLGITLEAFREGVERYGLDGIDGLHFHTLCEDNSDALAKTWENIRKQFDPWLRDMAWINMGGGHHLTRDDYDLSILANVIDDAHSRYPKAQLYLEPGEAVVLNTGFFVSQVEDLVHNSLDIAVLDASATCHMPDVLEVPYQPKVFVLKEKALHKRFETIAASECPDGPPEHLPFLYRLGGTSCLAGDVIGDYYFAEKIDVGDLLVFLDMALYTMVKTNTFNGIPLPAIYLMDRDGHLEKMKTFSYKDFKSRL